MDLNPRTILLARALSIVAHPAIVMPVAALIASSAFQDTKLIAQAVGLSAVCALLVMGAHRGVTAALALSAGIVIVGHLWRSAAKPSLHVAFGIFAALITWPNVTAMIAMLVLAAAVAWSRLILERHTKTDIQIGALLGIAAGIIFQVYVG